MKFRSSNAIFITMYFKRIISIQKTLANKSVLLLGARRTGKSSLIRHELKADRVIDLLKADQFQALAYRPSSLRESLLPRQNLIVVDEVQKLPSLLDEIHAMIEENPKLRFVLTGSSARKLKRTHTALLAGRTRRMNLSPFVFPEIGEKHFNLERYLFRGGLPAAYLAKTDDEARDELRDYAGDYIKEEILAEAIIRKIEAFSRFLPTAALTNGELLNFEAVASDSQVPSRTVREYYAVLEDTLIGRALEPLRFKGAQSRKSIATSKFYFFDTGALNALVGRNSLPEDSPEFGNLFETWVHNELRAYAEYCKPRDSTEIRFWRSPTGQEVDFVINREIGIEVKSTRKVIKKHTEGLLALDSFHQLKSRIVVSREATPKRIEGIEILPWRIFIQRLWAHELF